MHKFDLNFFFSIFIFHFSSKQRRVDDFVLRRGICTPEMARILTNSVLNMLVYDMRPISMVEGDGFKEMIHTFYPDYVLPSRTHFTKLMEGKYETVLNHVKDALKLASGKFALTADAWTSLATEAYLGITCHYLSDDWVFKNYCLTTMPLEERHTGVNIAGWIEEALEKVELPPSKIVGIVHDNARNIMLAANILSERHGWLSVRCAGHTIQLVVNHALKQTQISNALGAARALVEHFKKSELASSKLKLKQKQMGTPDHRLIQDVSTRWNSTYYMITRLLEQRWPVTATLSDPTATPQGKRYLDLKPDQWILLENLAKALDPFECATVFLSGESYVTISTLPPLYRGLMKSTSIAYDVAPVHAFQTAASLEMTEYCSDVVGVTDEDDPSKHIIAAALDPRFRKLKFLTPQVKFSVQSKLQDLALHIAFKNQPSAGETTPSDPPSTSRHESALDSLDVIQMVMRKISRHHMNNSSVMK